jgi:protein gp37
MSLDFSGISWTDGTLNSLYGCGACSVGCRLCYAVKRVDRHASNPQLNTDGRFDGLVRDGHFTNQLLFDPKHLYAVLKQRNPKMIFVNEFSDLLHEALPMDLILEHVRVFRAASWHQFQVLTKRGQRLAELNDAIVSEFASWPENLWMGTSVCSAAKIEMQRIEDLGATNAALKWISFEPWVSNPDVPLRKAIPALRRVLRKNRIAWTVIGGESGPRNDTNLMSLDDARYLIAESQAAGSKTHFKQLGTALAIQLGVYSTRGQGEHRAKGGNPDQWPEDLNIREWPKVSWKPVTEPKEFSPAYDSHQWRRYTLAASPGQQMPSDDPPLINTL